LSDVLEEQEYASMNLTLTGEDSQGNVGRSNSVKLLFSKFVQTLISVVVE